MRRDPGGWALLAVFVALVVLGGVLLGWLLARPIAPGPVVLPTPTIRVVTLTPRPTVVAVPPRAGATNTPEPASQPPVLVVDHRPTRTPVPPLVLPDPTSTRAPEPTPTRRPMQQKG